MPLRSLSFRGVPQKAQETLASRWSQFQYLKDWPSKALAISISQASLITLLELGLLGATLNGLNQLFGSFSGTSGIILIYFVLFILAQWFQALLSLDAFLTKNTMEAVAVQVFNVCVTVYAIVQIRQLSNIHQCGVNYLEAQTGDLASTSWNLYLLIIGAGAQSNSCPATDAFKFKQQVSAYQSTNNGTVLVHNVTNLDSGMERIAQGVYTMEVPISIAIAVAVIMILYNLVGVFTTYKVYLAYGWSLFMKQGASLKKRYMLRRYHVFILLLKLNVYFSTGILLQMLGVIYYTRKFDSQDLGPDVLMQVSEETTRQVIIPSCVVMIIAALGFYFLGWFGVRRSSYLLMSFFLALIMGNAAALSYALYMVFMDPKYKITIIWLSTFGKNLLVFQMESIQENSNRIAITAFIQLILNIFTVGFGIACMVDFSDGLHDVLYPESDPDMKEMPRLELD